MTDRRRARVGFLYTHPIQYVAPLLRLINQTADIEAVPIYLTDFSLRGAVDKDFGRSVVWDIDLLEGTDPIFVPGFETRALRTGLTKMHVPGMAQIIRDARLDALVLSGHSQMANHSALIAAKRRRIPVLYRSDTHLLLQRNARQRIARRVLIGAYYKLIDGFLSVGTRNCAFYKAMGVPERKLFDVPFAVDNERMIEGSTLDKRHRLAIRRQYGVRDGVPLIIYASKLTRRKHPDKLLEAARALRAGTIDFDLLFVGTGEMETELRAASAGFPGAPPLFAGFLNQSEMPAALGASDIFVLPAENEPWGLIINEAMAAGLAIVAADEVGAVPDLVHDGINGRVVKAGSVEPLASALRDLLTDMPATREMGARSREMITRWSFAEDIVGLRQALRATGALRC